MPSCRTRCSASLTRASAPSRTTRRLGGVHRAVVPALGAVVGDDAMLDELYRSVPSDLLRGCEVVPLEEGHTLEV